MLAVTYRRQNNGPAGLSQGWGTLAGAPEAYLDAYGTIPVIVPTGCCPKNVAQYTYTMDMLENPQ